MLLYVLHNVFHDVLIICRETLDRMPFVMQRKQGLVVEPGSFSFAPDFLTQILYVSWRKLCLNL